MWRSLKSMIDFKNKNYNSYLLKFCLCRSDGEVLLWYGVHQGAGHRDSNLPGDGTVEQGGSSLSPAWLSGIGLFCRHNSQYFARLSSLTEPAVCQLARRKNRNYLHTCLGLTNEGQESQTKCVGVTLGQNECDDTTRLKYLLSSPTLPACQSDSYLISGFAVRWHGVCLLPAGASSLILTIIDCEVESYGARRGLIYVHCWI